MNIELWLAREFDCISGMTGSPIGDCISLKLDRLVGEQASHQRLWDFLDIAGVPDVSKPLLDDQEEMAKFIDLTTTRDADAFRQWFHKNTELAEKELIKSYVDILHGTPWIQRPGGRVLRMVSSLGLGTLGLGFLVDATASMMDNFVLDKYARGKGAKFFIESLRKFNGRLPTSQ
jgi:hypothetical protein